MLHTKIQAEPSGSEKKNFQYFLCISMVQTQDPLGFWTQGPYLNKLGKGPQTNAITKFQAPQPSCPGEDFKLRISFSNSRPPPQGHFGPKGHHLNRLSRGPLDNATYQISKSKSRGFREDVIESKLLMTHIG